MHLNVFRKIKSASLDWDDIKDICFEELEKKTFQAMCKCLMDNKEITAENIYSISKDITVVTAYMDMDNRNDKERLNIGK